MLPLTITLQTFFQWDSKVPLDLLQLRSGSYRLAFKNYSSSQLRCLQMADIQYSFNYYVFGLLQHPLYNRCFDILSPLESYRRKQHALKFPEVDYPK